MAERGIREEDVARVIAEGKEIESIRMIIRIPAASCLAGWRSARFTS
jgi:hypothetical protein